MQVYKGIELIEGIGPDCNVYVIDGELIVDAGTGKYFGRVKKEIEAACDISEIKTLVNTHCHFDHTGGNKKFRDWLKLQVAVHASDKEAVETGRGAMAEMFDQTSRVITIDRILRDGHTIRTRNFSFEVIHTPGHTPGSICLYEKDKKILISGDTLFDSTMGRTDFPGGNRSEMTNSLRKLSQHNFHYLLPGHGSPKISGINFLIKQMMHYMTVSKKVI